MTVFLVPFAVGTSTFAAITLINRTEGLSLNRRWFLTLPLALTALTFAVAPLPSLWTILLLAILSALAVTDFKTQLLPDWLTGTFIVTGLLQSGLDLQTLIGATIFVACALLSALLTKDEGLIGSADYLLYAGLIAWLGPLFAFDAMIITLFLFGLQLIVTRRKIAALAPALSIGLIAIWLKGPIL